MPKLILRRKTEIVVEFLISKTNVTIGSSEDNDIVINDQSISLRHCEVFEAGGKFYVKDSKSAFGTYINRKRVGQSEIKYGDTLNLANSVYDVLFYPVINEIDQQGEIPERYFLLAIQGKLFGKKFEIKPGETRIGRDEEFNDIAVSGKLDASVSRRHATLHSEKGGFTITDKRSRNRTFVNQKVVGESEAVDVFPDDEILIGHNIFRFIRQGEEDYSTPKKAGIFLDRFKVPALKLLAGLLIACSVCAMFYSAYRILVINNKPARLSAVHSRWEPKVNMLEFTSAEEEYGLSPSLALGNRGSRKNKIVAVAAKSGEVYLINPETGASAWPCEFSLKEGISGSPIMADLNSDSISDVVVCGNDSRLYFIDGLSGELIYRSEILGGKLNSVPACADFNEDGRADVVCCSEDGVVLFVYSPANAPREYTVNFSARINSSPVIFTDPLTKRLKVCVALADGKVYFFDGFDRNYFMLNTAEGINKRKGTSLTSNDIGNVPVVADMNNDGDMDLIVASKHYYIASFNIRTTDLQWEYTIQEKVMKDFPDQYPSVVVTELNNDDILDVVAAWPNGRVYAIDGETGGILWKQQTDEWNRFIATPALADLNKDGFADVIVGGGDGYLYVFDGMASIGINMDRTLKKEKVSANQIDSTPIVADIDNDGYMDILYKDSLVKMGILRTNSRVLTGETVWGMCHKDSMNTGIYIVRTRLWFFVLLEIMSIAVIIGVIAAVFIVKRQKGVKKPPVVALKEELTY